MVRLVEPKVRVIQRPKVDWPAVREYLEEVGGTEWYDRIDELPPEDFPDGAGLVEFMGRACYRAWKPGLNPNVSRVRTDTSEYLWNILKQLHGSVLEHANYTFVFSNVSRVFTHELVRHRAGSAYSQESMRYVRLTDIPIWIPDWALKDDEFMAKSMRLLNEMEDFQTWMADKWQLDATKEDGTSLVPFEEKKAKTSFMRRFAPDGVATMIGCTMNVRALRHIIALRTSPAAEEEIRLVFEKVGHMMKAELPDLFADFVQDESGAWVPEFGKV